MSLFSEIRKLFKELYQSLIFPLPARIIQGSTLFEGVYYSRKYGIQVMGFNAHCLFPFTFTENSKIKVIKGKLKERVIF